jgi:hypothetical protein
MAITDRKQHSMGSITQRILRKITPQHAHQQGKDADAEHLQIGFDVGDHVIGDHADAAEKQGRPGPVAWP